MLRLAYLALSLFAIVAIWILPFELPAINKVKMCLFSLKNIRIFTEIDQKCFIKMLFFSKGKFNTPRREKN